MVGARSLAMALNRLIDVGIDAAQPAHGGPRASVAALLTVGAVVAFCVASLVVFLIAVWQLDPIVRWLVADPRRRRSSIYPYLKRFTWLCHLWLGAVDGLAPVGGWVAVTRRAAVGGVGARRAPSGRWVAGFDLFYSLFDVEVDREQGLHSLGDALRRARRLPRRARLAPR